MLRKAVTPIFKIGRQLVLELFVDYFQKGLFLNVKVLSFPDGVESKNLDQGFNKTAITVHFYHLFDYGMNLPVGLEHGVIGVGVARNLVSFLTVT